jgi:hypothetical protein
VKWRGLGEALALPVPLVVDVPLAVVPAVVVPAVVVVVADPLAEVLAVVVL